MHVRELPRAEWDRLEGLEMGALVPALPADTRMVIVEDGDGAIVGTWAVIRYVHVEGLWIAPPHQKRGRVGAYLLEGMRRIARSWGASAVLTGCMSDEVETLLEHVGGMKLPGDQWAFPVERR